MKAITTAGNVHYDFYAELFASRGLRLYPAIGDHELLDDRPGHLNNANKPYRPKPDFNNKYFGANLGGPIIKDKLTFFVDFEGTNKTFGSSDINVYPGNISVLPPAEQAYAQSARSQFNGSFPATFKEKLYFGKLTYFATPDDTINLSGFLRRESNLQINGGISVVKRAIICSVTGTISTPTLMPSRTFSRRV